MNWKSCLLGALLLMAIVLCPPVAKATQMGELTVDYKYDGAAVAQAEISIYAVADGLYPALNLAEGFAGCDVDFSKLSTSAQWQTAAQTVQSFVRSGKANPTQQGITDDAGVLKFENLTAGIYYVEIDKQTIGNKILVASSALVAVPYYNNDTNTWEYEVTISPKSELVPKPTKPKDPEKPKDPDDPDDPDEPPPPPDDPHIPSIEIPTPEIPLIGIPDDPDSPDTPETPIPETGTNTWLVLPLILAGLILVLAGWLGLRGKRHEP